MSNKTIYQVSELTKQIQQMLEASYRSVWVEAEISSLSKPASGHWYFSLKDQISQIRCAMFRRQVSNNNYKASEGDLVRVRGKVTVYAARGDMQMIIEHIEPAGEGVLQKRFEELKAKLQQEGLFAQQLKQALPRLPKSIGIITSPTGAAVKDVLSTIDRRFPTIPTRIYPAVVQGAEAPEQLIAAINLANQDAYCDVIVLTRGGGSLEDLWCFNDEQLARTIVASNIPIVSAVGHEVDISLADFAADLRAPTPTAAAEIITPDRQTLQEQLITLSQRLGLSKGRYFTQLHQNIDWQAKRLRHPNDIIQQHKHQLTQLRKNLAHTQQRQLDSKKTTIEHLYRRLASNNPQRLIEQKQDFLKHCDTLLKKSMSSLIEKKHQSLRYLNDQLMTLSYERTLDRGYAIIKNDTGHIMTQAINLNTGENVTITLADGTKHAVIKDIDSA